MTADVVDRRTGEIVTVDNAALEQMTPAAREAAVTEYLGKARDWLATCVELTGPEAVARVKAEIATAAEATKQLHLSKEIQEDAVEMVRRAEYSLDKAVRKGRADGVVETVQDAQSRAGKIARGLSLDESSSDKTPVSTLLNGSESRSISDEHNPGISGLADYEPEQFDQAIGEAKKEHNLSRPNVVRKLKGNGAHLGKLPEAKRVEQITELTERGRSVEQIAQELGIGEPQVRNIANRNGITTVNQRLGRGVLRQPKSGEVAERIVAGLETTTEFSIPLVTVADLDPAQCKGWAESLKKSLSALNRFKKALEGQAQS